MAGCGSGNFPGGGGGVIPFNGIPTGSCSSSQLAVNTQNGHIYSCVNGIWMPMACGCGGGGGGTAEFVDDVLVPGSGTAWALPSAPNPIASLQLFQTISGFGSILLLAGTDYLLSGTTITTINTIVAGALRAWYRLTNPLGFTFSDAEVVGGSGTAWTLANTPNPLVSLELYQIIPGFGGILLIEGTDYTLAGLDITTVNPIGAGLLRAWYRY